MKKKILGFLAVILFTVAGFAQTKEKMDLALSKGNVVFLVVTEGNTKLSEAKEMALKAQIKYPKSEVITFDKTDNTNAVLVSKFGLAGAPTPIILVVAANGVVTGGYVLGEVSPEKLIEAIPTKNQAEALLAFSEGKSAFIILYKKTMTDKSFVLDECKKAAAGLNGKVSIVELNLEDKSESPFLALLKPDMSATTAHLLVFNAKGQFTDEFQSPVQSAAIIASSRKIISSSCAPGAGSNCCPK